MREQKRGFGRNNWLVVISYLPIAILLSNGTLFNRHNIEAQDALAPWIHGLIGISLIVVIVLTRRWRKQDEANG